MGDTNRNIKFSQFIIKQFPKANSILVIADGKGELARKLANKGKIVRIIENKPRWEGRLHKNIIYQKGFFTADQEIKEDLIIGMHPDEATGEILLAAKKQNKHFAVVPCCAVGRFSDKMKKTDYLQWMEKLQTLFRCKSYDLHIQGRNTVLYQNGN